MAIVPLLYTVFSVIPCKYFALSGRSPIQGEHRYRSSWQSSSQGLGHLFWSEWHAPVLNTNVELPEDWEALYDSDVATATASDRNHLVPLPCFSLHFDSCLAFLHAWTCRFGFSGHFLVGTVHQRTVSLTVLQENLWKQSADPAGKLLRDILAFGWTKSNHVLWKEWLFVDPPNDLLFIYWGMEDFLAETFNKSDALRFEQEGARAGDLVHRESLNDSDPPVMPHETVA